MWQVQTVEMQLNDESQVYYIHFFEEDQQFAILFEDMDGESDTFNVEIEGVRNASAYRRTKVFLGGFVERGRGLIAKIKGKIGSFIRITIASIREAIPGIKKELASWWGEVRCRGCKTAVRLLLGLALSIIGVPYLDAPVMSDDQLVSTIESIPSANQEFMEFIRQIDVGLWDGIVKAIGGLTLVSDLFDRFFEMVCRSVGFCR